MVEDWHQLWVISSTPDNVPIVGMIPLVIFFTWLGVKQAREHDQLIDRLESDPQLAKTHHRKALPWRPGWAREIHVWPYLVRVEFIAALIVTVILFVWSITLNAPLEEPANPNLTMNPSKAPWYFLGLQEMLVYFDPWIAGVVMPGLLVVGLMVFPYVDSNPLGNGYYTWKQRKFAIGMFGWGFFMWIILIIIGTFIRGPGWIWFWPGQTWDHNAVVYDRNVDLHEYIGITSVWGKAIFGALVVGAFFVLGGLFFHWLMTRTELDRKILQRTSLLQYLTFQFFAISVLLALPVK
ncbi:MAG: cytochrome C, partial [Acidobacteria bacterium]|nr:cytochrome C [Acidobacteriota bacterium]